MIGSGRHWQIHYTLVWVTFQLRKWKRNKIQLIGTIVCDSVSWKLVCKHTFDGRHNKFIRTPYLSLIHILNIKKCIWFPSSLEYFIFWHHQTNSFFRVCWWKKRARVNKWFHYFGVVEFVFTDNGKKRLNSYTKYKVKIFLKITRVNSVLKFPSLWLNFFIGDILLSKK